MEFNREPEIQDLSKELNDIKSRITKLLAQARQGIITIQVSVLYYFYINKNYKVLIDNFISNLFSC